MTTSLTSDGCMVSEDSFEPVSLAGSLQPLIDHFNCNKNTLRFLALLSPTGPGGRVEGARAVQKSIIEEFPNLEINIYIVWVNMLPGDSASSATESARMFKDHRVRQFYDPNQYAARAIAEHVGWRGRVAWDIYLFYPAGGEWAERPPTPSVWMHQLRETWADHEHFHSGDDLVKTLFETMKRLTGRP